MKGARGLPCWNRSSRSSNSQANIFGVSYFCSIFSTHPQIIIFILCIAKQAKLDNANYLSNSLHFQNSWYKHTWRLHQSHTFQRSSTKQRLLLPKCTFGNSARSLARMVRPLPMAALQHIVSRMQPSHINFVHDG